MRIPTLLAALVCAATPLAAQVADTSPFRRLELPAPNEYRSASGAPGARYWQNRADYAITASLDTATHEIRGRETIRYTNNSPDSLHFVWLQTDQDIFAANSINRSAPPPDLVFAGAPFVLAVSGPAGGFTIDTLGVTGQRVWTYHWDTMLRVNLERALAPGQSLELTIAWHFTVPVNGAARMGRDGQLYEIAQWYPRLAVYDDVHGWNTLPYVGAGEFYLEYGDITAALTVPAGFVVASTGTLQNPNDVLTAAQRDSLARARHGDRAAIVIGYPEAQAAATRPVSGTRTWRFAATNVRDLAWATASNFIWEATNAPIGTGDSVLIQAYYRPNAANWGEATEMARHAIRANSVRWFPYPYPQASVVEGPIQGMEYPMIVFVPPDTSRHSLSWVMMHELGHEWFPMTVGSDERRYPWMDEGFNSFIDLYTVAEWFANEQTHADSVLNGPLTSYAQNAVRHREQAMITAPAEVHNVYWSAYQKPALMLRLLREDVLGPEAFDPAFREYVRRWAFRHPQPADFFRTIENVSGRSLDWYWRQWVYTTSTLDQLVESVTPGRDTSVIRLAYRHEMTMPAELAIRYADGREETRRIPVEMWNYGPRFELKVPGRVTRVTVDPRGLYPDLDRSNNRWPRAR